jgi:hypothetical protein
LSVRSVVSRFRFDFGAQIFQKRALRKILVYNSEDVPETDENWILRSFII